MVIIAKYELLDKGENIFEVVNTGDASRCPHCNRILDYRDSRLRIRKKEGGEKQWLIIRRMRCEHCGCLHNELPDCLVPYKHYEAEVISGVLDEVVTPDDEDSEDYPCVDTMRRWLEWFRRNRNNIEGHLRRIGFSVLELGEEILSCSDSMLDAVRKNYFNWLERILRLIWNTGGSLPSLGSLRRSAPALL